MIQLDHHKRRPFGVAGVGDAEKNSLLTAMQYRTNTHTHAPHPYAALGGHLLTQQPGVLGTSRR